MRVCERRILLFLFVSWLCNLNRISFFNKLKIIPILKSSFHEFCTKIFQFTIQWINSCWYCKCHSLISINWSDYAIYSNNSCNILVCNGCTNMELMLFLLTHRYHNLHIKIPFTDKISLLSIDINPLKEFNGFNRRWIHETLFSPFSNILRHEFSVRKFWRFFFLTFIHTISCIN